MEKSELYQIHLDRTSRSFAFCIRQLPLPLREWVGLSYLLCRTLDTIEDAAWTSPEKQQQAFHAFDQALMDAKHTLPVDWVAMFPAGVTEGEIELLKHTDTLVRDFHALPIQVHSVIRELILSMSMGMQHFCGKKAGGPLYLRTISEVNQYCFFVAGIVGELLANLIARVDSRFTLSQQTLLRAHHFGLFLQKVNLLKDQVGDEKLGRHFIPSREMVESSSHENARWALDFLLHLPKEQVEFRRFCAWSLFLGLETLSVARRSLHEKRVLKVARTQNDQLLLEVEDTLSDDGALRKLFDKLCAQLGWTKPVPPMSPKEVPKWLLKLYRGPLDTYSLQKLGVSF